MFRFKFKSQILQSNLTPTSLKSILFLFLDGVGIGNSTPLNPFSNSSWKGFEAFSNGQTWTTEGFASIEQDSLVCKPIDALLGVEGLPQSGTGQSTLFTGINCAELAGRHYGPYPHSSAKSVLKEHNVFVKWKEAAVKDPTLGRAMFLNAFPNRFIKQAELRNRWSVTTRCCLDAGIPLRRIEALDKGEAIAADLTGRGLKQVSGAALQVITEEEAATRTANLCKKYGFLLYENFLTDKAGHGQDLRKAEIVLISLDRFLLKLHELLDFDQTTVIITSDHGNIEDLGTKSHTMNPVPFVAKGALAHRFKHVNSIQDITPAIFQ